MPYRTLAPDQILTGGIIHTMNVNDFTATALAIKDGSIVGAGLDDEMLALSGEGTVHQHLEGRTIIPGLIDAHNHLLATGETLQQVRLYDCRTMAEIVDRVAAAVKRAKPGDWILGRGWDETLLVEQRHPTRYDLDPVSPQNPVVLHRVWNKLTANSLAVLTAGVDRNTTDPSSTTTYSGSFERDASGDPTGLFRDRAKDMITSHIAEPAEQDLVSAIEITCRAYNAVGITGVAEPGLYAAETRAFQRAAREGRLTVRVDMLMAAWGFGDGSDEPTLKKRLELVGLQGGFGDDLLRLEGVKLMPDGGVGDRTARMFEPYLNEPDNRGLWVVDPHELPSLVRWVHDLGFSIDAHTCGDEAQQLVVGAYASAQDANPKPWLRHRVHHAYFPTSTTIGHMRRHSIPAVVSNPFITNLGESFVISLGEDRASTVMPMRTYLDAGIPLAGASDSSVSDYNPWVGLYAATTRKTVTGRVLGVAERITAREALRSYTIGGAYATGRERIAGTLEPGKLADLVLLDNDPLNMPPDDLRVVQPVATMLGGRWVFDRR